MLILILFIVCVLLFVFNSRPTRHFETRPTLWPWTSKAEKEKQARITEEINTRFGGDYSAWKKRNYPY